MFAAQDRKKVKITDVKVMIVQCMRVSPLIKIETDAGIYGIGEAHHDVWSLPPKLYQLDCE